MIENSKKTFIPRNSLNILPKVFIIFLCFSIIFFIIAGGEMRKVITMILLFGFAFLLNQMVKMKVIGITIDIERRQIKIEKKNTFYGKNLCLNGAEILFANKVERTGARGGLAKTLSFYKLNKTKLLNILTDIDGWKEEDINEIVNLLKTIGASEKTH